MNYSDRLEILTNVNADPLDVGTSKVVFFYTNGKKFTATNVVQLCFTESSTIEYGYRVPFGGIHVFIGKIGELAPKPDICTDIIEMAQRARSARVKPVMKRAFVGVIHGGESEDRSESGGETVVYSGDESSTGETESLY